MLLVSNNLCRVLDLVLLVFLLPLLFLAASQLLLLSWLGRFCALYRGYRGRSLPEYFIDLFRARSQITSLLLGKPLCVPVNIYNSISRFSYLRHLTPPSALSRTNMRKSPPAYPKQTPPLPDQLHSLSLLYTPTLRPNQSPTNPRLF